MTSDLSGFPVHPQCQNNTSRGLLGVLIPFLIIQASFEVHLNMT